MLQAPMFDGLFLDGGALGEDLLVPPEAGIGRHHIAQALMVTLVAVVVDERLDLSFEIAKQVVVLQQDAVLQRLVPALKLALRLGVEGSAAHMAHGLGFDIGRRLGRMDVACARSWIACT